MPPTGSQSQPQTLAYRVEIEQSSLSEVVQQIQASVGQAMSTAIATVQGFSTQGHATTAVAMGTAGGNLAFMEQQRARLLTQPTAAPAGTGYGVSGVAQAMAIKAGLVDPGFSQTASGMSAAAGQIIQEVKASIPEMISKAGKFTSGVLNWSSLVGILPGMGPIGLGLAGAGAALDLSMVGLDRLSEQESVRRMLMRYGDGPARSIVRELDFASWSMKGTGFDEISQVARSAILNIGPENLNASQARNAVMSAVQDWRMAGKVLGVSKDEALDVTGALYRMGIRPGEGAQNLFGNVATAAQGLGVSTTALAQSGMQVAQMSQPLGYDALASQNQFMIQTATLAEAMRSGTVTSGQRAMMSGFVGPQADQAVAAAGQYMASMRVLGGSGFGQIVSLGMERGVGAGNISALMGGAAGASMEQILTNDIRARRNMDQTAVDALQQTLASSVTEQIKQFGMNLNRDTFVAMAMKMHPQAFQTEGAAQMAWMNASQPWHRERVRGQRMMSMGEAADELRRPASGLAQVWDENVARTARGWDRILTGRDPNPLAPAPDVYNFSVAGAARYVGAGYRATANEAIETLWESWEYSPREERNFDTGFLNYVAEFGAVGKGLAGLGNVLSNTRRTGGTWGRGTARRMYMAQTDIEGMTDEELLAGGRAADTRAAEVLKENKGFIQSGDTIGAFKRTREEIMSRAWARTDRFQKMDLTALATRIGRITGTSVSDDDARSLITNSFDLRNRLYGKTGAARDTVIESGIEELRLQAPYSQLSRVQLRDIVNQVQGFNVEGFVTSEEQLQLELDAPLERRRTTIDFALGNSEAWQAFSSKVFKPGSKIAEQLRARAGNISESEVRALLNQANIEGGHFNQAFLGGLKGRASGVAAMRELLMAGAMGKTKGIGAEDLPATSDPKAQGEKLDELVKRMGELTTAIQNYITSDRNARAAATPTPAGG